MPPKQIIVPPSPTPPPTVSADEPHDLLIIQDMVDTFEQIPPELTRVHSDLNELGAVLYSTLLNLERKLDLLIGQIGDETVGPEKRFQLLQEIGEEAARYKLGGDDKIRVAAGACDGILVHQKHLQNLVDASTLFVPAPPSPYTQTLTVPLPPVQGSSRRGLTRAANSPFGGRAVPSADKGETPTKRKKNRVQQLGGKEDDEVSNGGGEKKRISHKKRRPLIRAFSPAESLGSSSAYTTKLPLQQTARQIAAAANKARKAEQQDDGSDAESQTGLKPSSLGMQPSPSTESMLGEKGVLGLDVSGGVAISRENSTTRAGNGKDVKEAGRAARARGVKRGREDEHEEGESELDVEEERPAHKRTSTNGKKNVKEEDNDMDGGGDGDTDTKRYCLCQQVSYGEMLGCDDDECEVEWFHLACLGLDSAPSSTEPWICPMCTERRKKHPKTKRPVKGGGKGRK
ncbi:hypothetical protein M231_05539 [Tremella mesenterica]|uniref:Chromatin modification-related protein n=1 Tax=Tremella mesenterica TaxID=5217 RepID=A0A4Q1BHT2_TREME|nr:hypothetical protein M231_05539 [Tremella mesenterica]